MLHRAGGLHRGHGASARFETAGSTRTFRLFATDVNTRAIEKAARGRYTSAEIADVPDDMRERFFRREAGGGYHVKKDLRDTILFSRHNVLRDPRFQTWTWFAAATC